VGVGLEAVETVFVTLLYRWTPSTATDGTLLVVLEVAVSTETRAVIGRERGALSGRAMPIVEAIVVGVCEVGTLALEAAPLVALIAELAA